MKKNKSVFEKIWKQDEITEADYEGIPIEERQYYHRLATHRCVSCGDPLPVTSGFQTYCKKCREDLEKRRSSEYARLRRRRVNERSRTYQFEKQERRKTS